MKLTWKSWLILTAAVLGVLFILDARVNAKATTSNQSEFTFDVSDPVSPVLSAAVRDLAQNVRETYLAREVNPIQWLGEGVGLSGPSIGLDPLVGRSMNGGVSPDPLVTFEGVPSVSGVTPPDTNGDVGPDHYIQMTNFSFQIWDKGDPNNGIPPTPLTGPTLTGNLFAPLGGQCASNFGDPIVVYDDMADRWLLTQFGLNGPLAMCLAVSTTPDPLGTYFLYEITTPDFPDYPKFGVWPDAYYMTTNTGFPNQYFAHAFDRVAMLAGAPATRQSFGGLPNLMLPADVDGPVAPPAGEPGIFYTYFHPSATGHPPGAERLAFYEFDVDWVTPANSTYTLVAELPVAPFNYTICGFFAGGCVPQPGTGQLLDDIAWWPMHRMQYRNFGGYEAMVGNFTVDGDGANHAGIRWFEVHKTGSTYSLYQEGTHFPDTDSRWMGSVAMDISGNIALGYSVSSSSTIPSIRYATRLAGDPLGTLNAEAEMWTGGGVQTGIHRWGDYSAMMVDPVDNCTFWFTTEYHDINDSGFGWNTRVGVFRIPSCGGPSGTLTGQVTDSVTNNGIPGAAVQATASVTKTGFTTTDANGFYTMTLLEGSYYVTATAFAYLPDSVSGVNVISGTTTTQDFALDPADNVVVEGYVTDDLMDWPLYARIDIGGGFPGGPVWTDPVSGYYSVTLPVGSYPFEVSAFVEGYTPQTTIVTVTSVVNVPTGINIPVAPVVSGPLVVETVSDADANAPSVVAPLSDFRVPEALLHDNGPLVTHPGGGAGGADESRLQNVSLGMTIFGFGHNNTAGLRVADDFTISDPGGWDIDNIIFYGYQTGSTTTSTFTGVYLQIWDGPPNAGGTVIWGNTTTNVMTSSVWANMYRVTENGIGGTTRPVMANTVSLGGLHLDPGTYWLDWSSTGSLASGPWAPPITINGQTVTGNGLQFNTAWGNLLDGTNQQGLPFQILGTVVPGGGGGNQTANFALPADLNVCSAPGYTPVPSGGFSDDFESGFGNWTLTGLWNPENQADTCGSLVSPFPSPSNAAYYGVDGTCTFNNGGANIGELTLNTPVTVGAGSVLEFSTFEQTECGGPACPYDARNVQISTNGGSSWTTIYDGGTENTWRTESLDLSPFAGSALVRFQFDTVDSVANDFFGWMVDDVSISTYTCMPPTDGGLVVGNVYDLNTSDPVNGAWVTNETGSVGYAMETPLDPAVDDAFYTVYSLSGSQVHTATYTLYGEDVETVGVVDFDTVEQDFYLPSGFVVVDPTAFDVTLEFGTNTTLAMTMTDIGGANVEFVISEVPGTNPFAGPSVSVPASDGNFPRGDAPTSMGAAPTSGKPTTGPRSTLAELLGSNAYSIDHANFFYTIFDTDVPEVLPNIGGMPATGDFIGAGELIGDKVYMVDTLNVMWEVDAATGTILNTYSATPPGGGETYSGLALDPTDGTVYAASTNCATASLYTIDAPTGAATLVGTVSNGGCLIGIAVDGNGDLWGYDIIADVLVWIDKSTGAGTVIGSIGFDANFGQGMGWDPATDTLYMAAFNGGAFVPELRAVDRTTGNTTLIGVLGQTDPGVLSQLPWLGFEIAGGGDVPWVSEAPITGTIPANNDSVVAVTFDAAQVPVPGQYTAFLNIAVDTPQVELTVPLTLNVTCSTCGTLEGDITDAATNLPLVASVHITSTGGFDFTIEDVSSYSILLAPGTYNVTASATGYISETASVPINTGATTTQDFALWANTSILSFSPASVEEFMNIGDVVTNTVTVTNSGAAAMDFEVSIGGYSGPLLVVPVSTQPLSIPASDGNFPRGDAPTSMGAAPTSGKPTTGPRSTLAELLGSNAYSIDHANFFYTIFDTDVPEVLPNIGGMPATGDFIGAGELIGDKVYMVDTLNVMWEVDAATGTILNTYSATPPGGGETYSGLALDPTDGTVYAASTNCATASLYTIDAPTGAATLVGTVSNGGCLIGIAVDGNGDLWGYDIIADVLVWIDKSTGAGTVIGSIGFDANFGQGMGWDPATDTLYMAAFNGGAFVPELRAVDRTTGNTTLIGVLGQTDPGVLSQLPWLGFEIAGGGSGGWAYAVPDFGTVPPFSSTTFELVFDARSLFQTGDYYATLSFNGTFANDPGTMPLTMHVSCPTCGFLVGDIYDDQSFVPVEANVYVSSDSGTAITLTNVASYSLALQPGSYDFLVTADGYFSETATVEVEEGETVVTDFALTQIVAILEYSPSAFERTVALGQVFTDTLVLNNSGTIAYDFYLSDVGTGAPSFVAPVVTCPEDAYGYTCIDSNEPGGPAYNFEDISGTGTVLSLSDDSVSAALPLGFSFNYYDIDYTEAYVSSNGFLTFLAGQYNGCCSGVEIPTAGDPDGLVAAWWEDINPSAGGSIYYETLGSAPNQVFIVQFSNVPHYPSGNEVTFQYKLFEGTDQIEIHYQAAPSDGGPHAAGIENETGTVGVQYYFGTSALTTPLAVRYGRATDALWLIELPATGTVDAGGAESVSIIFDASVITQTGTYTAELRFDGTFDNAVAPATVVMHVIDNPAAGVTISDSTGIGNPDTVVTHTMWITNTGNFADIYDLSIAGNAWATDISVTTVTLDPGESVYVMCFVTIPGNTADGDTDTVTVTATSRFDDSVSDTGSATTEADVPEPPTYDVYLPILKKD